MFEKNVKYGSGQRKKAKNIAGHYQEYNIDSYMTAKHIVMKRR